MRFEPRGELLQAVQSPYGADTVLEEPKPEAGGVQCSLQITDAIALASGPQASPPAAPLNSVGEKPLLLAQWAGTPVGTALAGTTIVVTERYEP